MKIFFIDNILGELILSSVEKEIINGNYSN
jgi:hypothetical protein